MFYVTPLFYVSSAADASPPANAAASCRYGSQPALWEFDMVNGHGEVIVGGSKLTSETRQTPLGLLS